MNVLQHVADTQAMLSEIRRVLAPGGLLAVAVPFHGRVRNVLTALRGFERHYDPFGLELRFFTERSLRSFQEFGYRAGRRQRRAAGWPRTARNADRRRTAGVA